ncbi:MAG: SCO family protein [Pseudomonadota bacterium]
MKKIVQSICAAAVFTACSEAPDPRAQQAAADCATRTYSEIGGPISLIDQTGATVTEADFIGRSSLVYFGFTYCPDICPATLVTIDRALARLPENIEPPRTVLISIDPERDTPATLADYVSTPAFPDDLIGLTGSSGAVKAAADAFKTGYQRIDTPESLADYTMDHTSIVYLMDETWSLKTFFTHEATSEIMATCLAQHLG